MLLVVAPGFSIALEKGVGERAEIRRFVLIERRHVAARP
jgi:hypothetical protein